MTSATWYDFTCQMPIRSPQSFNLLGLLMLSIHRCQLIVFVIVCLSVRPSQVGVVVKRQNTLPMRHNSPGTLVLLSKRSLPNSYGITPIGDTKYTWVKFAFFHRSILWPVWLNGRAFARDPKGRGFESRPVRFQVGLRTVTALGKLLTSMCLCRQAYIIFGTSRWAMTLFGCILSVHPTQEAAKNIFL